MDGQMKRDKKRREGGGRERIRGKVRQAEGKGGEGGEGG